MILFERKLDVFIALMSVAVPKTCLGHQSTRRGVRTASPVIFSLFGTFSWPALALAVLRCPFD